MKNHNLWSNPPGESSEETTEGTTEDSESSRSDAYSDGRVLRRVFQESAGYRWHIVLVLFLNLLATPLALLTPVPLALAVDNVIGDKPVPGLLDWMLPEAFTSTDFRLLLVTAGLLIVVELLTQFQWLSAYLLETYTGEKLTLRFRARLFRHVQRLSLAFHDSRGTSDSVYRIQYDAPSIHWLMASGAIPLVSAFATLLAMVYVMARLDWQLSLVALVVAPALFWASRRYKLRMRSDYDKVRDLESGAMGVVQEVLTSLRVVKAFGREENEQNRFVRSSADGMRARIRLALAEGAFGLKVNLLTAIGTATVLFMGVRSIQSGRLTVGGLLVIMAYLLQLYSPMQALSQLIATVQSALAGLRRSFELMDRLPDVEDKPGAKSLGRSRGEIEFENVSFTYDGHNDVIHGLTFKIEEGARLGIAGRTGAGKTTLINLLVRFYDPQSGRIMLDGTDIRDVKVSDLRNQFAIVLQEPVLFSTTIAENIVYARPESLQKDIEIAAKAANAHGFITSLPDGYDTMVGERGMRLSGGERQRIALARAFLKDAPVLILDEPTSSVDVKTESEIMQAMERLMLGRTTLMIAHRLSTLDYCDARLELDHGRVIQSWGLDTERSIALDNADSATLDQ